ncbi:MICAL-like protein 1 isoform X1 [Trichoplusia ni]|uniref:MICAL-like protein 1 isoform X1 n=1 Tax=Trichoplusia ni TaxID=7111 RepID=A0A7E5WV98_TRINI|nr:MICAL-like protein 1 isoform X1 [Trichoplusia ni]
MSERKGTKALELWCKRLVKDCPEVHIDNMTTSWRNGIAFCALVHHFRPDLIDMSKLKPENIYENNQLAYSVAEKHLGIPALLDPEDMVENDVPDRLSVLTYLSQFYQRLGHTVNTKASESESKVSPKLSTTESPAPIRFGKTGLDKCAACGLPVYLAQRLLVSHKLYHRRCFRCSKCSGHLNPKNFEIVEGSEFTCDSCKNEKTLSKYLNNNDHDQMGMLAFTDSLPETKTVLNEEPVSPKYKSRPQSILEKINMFEKNIDKDSVDYKISNISLKDNSISKPEDFSSSSRSQNEVDSKPLSESIEPEIKNENIFEKHIPDKVYKSNIDKFNFLQTQLADETINVDKSLKQEVVTNTSNKEKDCINTIVHNMPEVELEGDNNTVLVHKVMSNATDDSRIANSTSSLSEPAPSEQEVQADPEITISVPPRRKKQNALEKALASAMKKEKENALNPKEYPIHLNPFSDDEEEAENHQSPKKASTNPFGSSDEEDDEVPPIQLATKPTNAASTATPVKRLIAVNPFWSDGEEPSSEEDESHSRSSMYRSSMATSTPNLPGSMARRKKAKAPPPPPAIAISEAPRMEQPATSMDDVASISSFSSYNSTIHSDQKSIGKSTPILKKRRPAPTPPDSLSTVSGGGGSMEKGINTSGMKSIHSDASGRKKGPAPGLPLPERREVKLQMSPEDLQVQLDLLETQQLGLERQGVLIEKMIRDKCEGDDSVAVPQEEVEDLVIQLCELVNEKNDLFRKQTELMYIRRQQRLEQEQADIEHEIRIIQSRPAVNRIDSDKAREEKLVLRLVEIVRMRDELVQQIDAERRRERQEDLAIAASIASKRAQRNSESNSSSMKSVEVIPTPKKNKVKDKVKKQLKKAKHSLISKKKDESGDRKEEKTEKQKKLK